MVKGQLPYVRQKHLYLHYNSLDNMNCVCLYYAFGNMYTYYKGIHESVMV